MSNQLLHCKESDRGCQASELTPLVAAAVSLGFEIAQGSSSIISPARSLSLAFHGNLGPKRRFPAGHRFYHDCLREQEAKFLAWAIRIHQPGCWFVTHTFKYEVSGYKADRVSKLWLSRLNQAHKDISGGTPIRSATTLELQQRDVLHFHHLIFGKRLDDLSRKSWENRWLVLSGGFAAHYKAESEAASYLVKHQTRSSDGNLYLGGCWRGINPPRSVAACCLDGSASEAVAYSKRPKYVRADRLARAGACSGSGCLN